MTDLSPFAAALADAIARRHALDSLAIAGGAVPAQIAHQAEASIREAEQALLEAAQSNTKGMTINGPQDHPKG